MASVDQMMQEAVGKMIAELKALGLDPLIDITSERIGIIIPVQQIIDRISKNIPKTVYKYIDVVIEEKTLGVKGFIVIKIKKKQ
jgi:hypothetical protein